MKMLVTFLTLMLLSTIADAKTMKVSYYHRGFIGRHTASGEVFSPHKNTAASNHYKFGTILQLNYAGKTAKVCVNDTGGFAKYGRDLDVSKKVAQTLGFIEKGVVNVSYVVVYKPEQRTSCNESWRYYENNNRRT